MLRKGPIGLVNPFLPSWYSTSSSELSKQRLPIEYHLHIWLVSLQFIHINVSLSFIELNRKIKTFLQENELQLLACCQIQNLIPRISLILHQIQCYRKTFMVHQTFVRWTLHIIFKIVKSLIRHLGLAIGNVRHVWWFSWTLQINL